MSKKSEMSKMSKISEMSEILTEEIEYGLVTLDIDFKGKYDGKELGE
jgi:hypothetical protein